MRLRFLLGCLSLLAGSTSAFIGCASAQPARCAPERWEGECQLTSITKVKDAALPIPHVEFEAVYQPIANSAHASFTPGAVAERTFAKSEHELALYDYLEAHPRVPCRTEPPPNAACVPPKVTISLTPFDPETAKRTAAAPPITGCAQIEAESAQDRLRGEQKTQTFVNQRLQFAPNSAALPAEAGALAAEIAKLLAEKPSIECLGVIGQIASGEPPALAEQRAAAVRDLLRAQGVAPSRLLTIGVTAKVFGNAARPEEADPAERRVGFSVLLEAAPQP